MRFPLVASFILQPTVFPMRAPIFPLLTSRTPLFRRCLKTTPLMSLPTREEVKSASFVSCVSHSKIILGASTTLSGKQKDLLADMVATSNGARGFLVTLLSDAEVLIGDLEPLSESLVEVFGRGGEEIWQVLAKNVVMSSSMVVAYGRQGEMELQAGSLMTRERCVRVGKGVVGCENGFKEVLEEMMVGLEGKGGAFEGFLKKWGYDDGQLEEGRKWVAEVLKS